MVEITESELREQYDYEGAQKEVARALTEARRDFRSLLRFLGRYASWNGRFGAGVASLAGKIGRSRDLFLDEEHGAYHWLSIHSGHGGGAEADHFDWAVAGVRQAFRYVPPAEHDELRHQVHAGFLEFVQDHSEFFARVNAA